jgi:hypothetical protein
MTVLLASLLPLVPSALAAPDGAALGTIATPAEAHGAPAVPVEAVKKAVDAHVQERTREGNGVYRIRDERTGEVLELAFEHTGVVGAEGIWSAHDRSSRASGGKDYFACTIFHPARGPADRRYDLDFRVVPQDGAYVVQEVAIHKDGKWVDGRWVWTPREPKPQAVSRSSGT